MEKSSHSQISVHRLTRSDSKHQSDRWRVFTQFVEEVEHMYPSIKQWLERKVAPQLDTPHRRAFLLSSGDRPIASVVLKRGDSSKLCHVRIAPEFQDNNLGSLLFCLLAQEIRSIATEVHFTLPESLWYERREFFRSFGFSESHKANQQYRLFDAELSCSAPFRDFWLHATEHTATIRKFLCSAGYVDVPPLVMSIKPRFARAVISGEKRVEIRRSFSSKWVDHRLCIYSSAPEQKLLGEATVLSVVSASPEEIWATFGNEIGCGRAEFNEYAHGTQKLVAITLGDVREYEQPMCLQDIRALSGGEFLPPQSHRTLGDKDNFKSVITVAQELHSGHLSLSNGR
jgi:predicted transcriptional regulator